MFRKKALRILIFYYLLLLISKTILKRGRRGISFYDKKFVHFNYFTRRQKKNKGSIEFQIASSLIRYEDLHHNHCSSLYDITKAQMNS